VRHTASARLSSVLMPRGSQPGVAPPVRVERGACEVLVVVVPCVHIVDRPPRDLEYLVRLRAQRATDRVAEVDDRHDAVRISVHARGSREDADELVDARRQPDFLGDLSQDGGFGNLVAVDPTGDKPPFVVVGSPHEEHPVVLVEERGVDADLGRDVTDIAGEPGAYLGVVEAGAVGIFLRRDGEQLLVALAVERVAGVMEAGLRDGANLVEQRDDVDALEATCPPTNSLRPARALHPDLLGESARRPRWSCAVDRRSPVCRAGTRGRRRV
jgi:hypothetical protein